MFHTIVRIFKNTSRINELEDKNKELESVISNIKSSIKKPKKRFAINDKISRLWWNDRLEMTVVYCNFKHSTFEWEYVMVDECGDINTYTESWLEPSTIISTKN